MNIGYRLKKIREFRKLTQKQLGLALGYPDASASVRIAQYETNMRSPRNETALEIAKVLDCNKYIFIPYGGLVAIEDIMHELFWLEEISAGSFYIFQLEKYFDRNDEKTIQGSINEYNYNNDGFYPPVAIVMNWSMINEFMREWATRFRELKAGEITRDEYFEWKINWPLTCDDGGRFVPTYRWRKTSPSSTEQP